MKKTVSKMVITAVAAAMTFANMMSVSASANDGMRYNNKNQRKSERQVLQ